MQKIGKIADLKRFVVIREIRGEKRREEKEEKRREEE